MKLTNIGLYSNGREVSNLSFRDPSSNNPYKVKAVIGIDADEIVSSFYGECSVSKDPFYSMMAINREVVLRIALNPQFSLGKTYSDLRDDLYRAVASSRTGLMQIQFNNGAATVAALSGRITKFEAPHFNKEPEVQLTISCDANNAMLRGLTPVELHAHLIDPISTIDSPYSTAPHGVSMKLTFTQTSDALYIGNYGECAWSFIVEPGTIGASSGFLVSDELYISSELQNKSVYLVRGGVTTQLLDKLWVGSQWPMLFPGANEYEFNSVLISSGAIRTRLEGGQAPEAATRTYTMDEFSYYPTYWGV